MKYFGVDVWGINIPGIYELSEDVIEVSQIYNILGAWELIILVNIFEVLWEDLEIDVFDVCELLCECFLNLIIFSR